MANRGWDSRNIHSSNDDTPIACRLCSQVYPNKVSFIDHIDSHLARDEVLHNNHGNNNNNNIQARPTPPHQQREMAFRPHNQPLAVVMHNNLPTLRASPLPNNIMQRANRNVFETRPEIVNRNVLESRPNPLPPPPPVVPPEFNQNAFDARFLMQKVTRNDFNNLPLMVQQGNNNNGVHHVANNAPAFNWATSSQPRSGPSMTPPTPPPARRNPSLLAYVPPTAPPAGGSVQQPAPLGFSSSARARISAHRGRRRSQQRNVEMVASTSSAEQLTRPLIDLLDVPIRRIDFIDLENMDVDDDDSYGSRKKLDLELKL